MLARLDRPLARNAIDAAMVADPLADCAEPERRPRILVLTGSDGIFAAGADIRALRERRRVDAPAGVNSGLFDRIARLPVPTIAAVDGPALGGGAELAYACRSRRAARRTDRSTTRRR
jgi:enoyl-CoA hydratase